MTQRRIWLDVQADGGTTGPGPIIEIESFSSRARLNRAGDWSATLPATDPRAAELLAPRRTVLAWMMIGTTPTLIGGGVIETLTTQISADGESLVVSGRDLIEELARRTVGEVTLLDSGLDDFIDDHLPAGWAHTLQSGAPTFMARFSYENLLGCLASLVDKLPLWFRRRTVSGNVRHLEVLTALPGDYVLLATTTGDPLAVEANVDTCLIRDITETRQATDVISRLYAFGAGNAAARLTMGAATVWPDGSSLAATYTTLDGDVLSFDRTSNLIVNHTTESAYGRVEQAAAWKDISPLSNTDADVIGAANMLVAAAVEYLRRNRAPAYEYSLNVAAVRKTLLPGDLIWVQARRTRDGATPVAINRAVRVLEVATTVDVDGERIDGLTVATIDHWPVTDTETIVAEIRQSMVMERLPQQNASIDTISYREPIDDDYSADLHFWIGEETTTINQILVRFRVDPFRSTAKTIGGTASGSVDIPDHTHQVTLNSHTHSVSISSHTHDVPDHQHYILISPGTPTYDIGFSAAGTAGGLYSDASSSDFNLPTNADSGGTTTASGGGTSTTSGSGGGTTVTSAAGGGQTGLAVDISSALTLQYGIYQDSPGNTYAATALQWLVNGVAATATPISIGDGWYALDITQDVVGADGLRPAQAANVVRVQVNPASKSGKRCQVTAQIQSRTTIQAIAYR
jgi:hypothetical protein